MNRDPILGTDTFLSVGSLLAFGGIFCLVFGASPVRGAPDRFAPARPAPHERRTTDPASAASSTAETNSGIPAGTILPVSLPSISSKHAKAGDKIKGKLAQDVRLADGTTIRGGATLLGDIVRITNADAGRGATLTLKFDALVQRGKSTPIQTNLRALASTLEIEEAQMPTSGPGESDVYDWLTTQQIGGDSVYGKQGPVERGSRVVGESTYYGVFGKAMASADGRCRGVVAGNDWPQALWVFSADACGLYGFADLEIRHAGRTEPVGEIVLQSKRGPVKIRGGSGALLRVDGRE